LSLDSMDNSHWRCHNCSCEMTAVEKLTQYCVRMGSVSTKILEVLLDQGCEAHKMHSA
jgi:hypothetical protein